MGLLALCKHFSGRMLAMIHCVRGHSLRAIICTRLQLHGERLGIIHAPCNSGKVRNLERPMAGPGLRSK
jgi:hypothetical protein